MAYSDVLITLHSVALIDVSDYDLEMWFREVAVSRPKNEREAEQKLSDLECLNDEMDRRGLFLH